MGSAKTARDQSEGWRGHLSQFKGTYEPRRLPFPAPEELDTMVSKHDIEGIVQHYLHADPSCNLCQACIIIRFSARSLQSLLSIFHTLS